MIIEALRAVTGYVEFEVCGGFAERFINLCSIDGILLWNVQNDGAKVKAFTSVGGFDRMQRAVNNSGMVLLSSRERGFPQFAKRHKLRLGAAFGAILCIAFIVFMSSLIWSVEIVGNTTVKATDLTEYAGCIGIKPGAFKRNIDAKRAASLIVLNNKGLAWAAVNIFGGKAVIEVREVVPEITGDGKTPCNVIARKPGQIIKTEVFSGTCTVSENEAAADGDLLISGIIKNKDGSESIVHASGRVLAKTENLFSAETALTLDTEICTKICELSYFRFFVFDIPLNAVPEGEASGAHTDRIKAHGESLPFGITRRVFTVFENRTVTLTENQAALFSLRDCIYNMRTELSSADISSVDCKISKNGASVGAVLRARCIEDIAQISELEVDKID